MRRSTRLEPISAPSSKTSIIEAGCIQRSATNPRLSSKPNSANSKASERTQTKPLSLKSSVSAEGCSSCIFLEMWNYGDACIFLEMGPLDEGHSAVKSSGRVGKAFANASWRAGLACGDGRFRRNPALARKAITGEHRHRFGGHPGNVNRNDGPDDGSRGR